MLLLFTLLTTMIFVFSRAKNVAPVDSFELKECSVTLVSNVHTHTHATAYNMNDF
jgi:hypothetical protein